LGVLKPAIVETDVHLSQLPQSLSEMRLINTKRFNAGLIVSDESASRDIKELKTSREEKGSHGGHGGRKRRWGQVKC
jgi:hypothetical protein